MVPAGIGLLVVSAFFCLNMHVINPEAFRARARGESTGSKIADGQIDVARRWRVVTGLGLVLVLVGMLI